jgi:uncharacterized membrane protein YfcA
VDLHVAHPGLVIATFFFAGITKGVLGLGMPVITMGVLGAILSPAEAASLLLVPSFATNIWQFLGHRDAAKTFARFWPMMAGILVGAPVGSGLIAGHDARPAAAALGAVLVIYALLGLLHPRMRLPAGAETWASPIAGLGAGLLAGATGVFAIPTIPYLAALGLERDALIQALGLIFATAALALGVGLAWHGALPADSLAMSVLALAPALAGMALGARLRRKVHPDRFRRLFLYGLIVLGAFIVWHAASSAA